MAGDNLWWSYLYFQLPNYAFAVLFWTGYTLMTVAGVAESLD